MKKVLSILLIFCLIFSAVPFCALAEEAGNIVMSTNVERMLYCPNDTVKVNIDLTNNSNGVAVLRGKLYYDNKNLTLTDVLATSPADEENGSTLAVTHADHHSYVQLLWDVESDISNYFQSGTVVSVYFTVNENAESKDYDFNFEYIDGARYVFGENGEEPTWEYITDVADSSDFMTVNTAISNKLYFTDVPTGAYAGESVTLTVAFSGEEGLYIFNSKLHFDAENYTLTRCVSANDSLNLTYNVKNGYVNLLWDNKDAENFAEESAVATLTFAVSENATAGTSRFELEYVNAVSINLEDGADVTNVLFNTYHCQFPLLTGEKVPVNIILNRGNNQSETVVRYAGETLVLPDTDFIDKTWYTSATASVNSIYTETVCPATETVLYSSACAVDYGGSDIIVPFRYSQDFSVVKEDDSEVLHFASGTTSPNDRMFRLSKVEDNATYKLTVTYKATIDAPIGLGFAGADGNNMYVNTSYFEGDYSTSVYSITQSTDGYVTADVYFTASLKGTVEEQSQSDDTKNINGNGWCYLLLINSDDSSSSEVSISELSLTKIGTVISAGGASLLNDTGYNAAENKQAIRYYFSYNTVVVTNEQNEQVLNITVGDNNYEIVARGFLYRNGAVSKYVDSNNVTKEGMNFTAADGSSDIITQSKFNNFNQCWEYNRESGELCFSTYISGYTESMYDYKLMVRGFVTFKDKAGNEFTVYSETINRCVNGMMDNPLNGVDVI